MWSDEYNECDRLISETLNVLCQANKSNLFIPLCRRMDQCAGERIADFNRLCRKLIRRYERQSQ